MAPSVKLRAFLAMGISWSLCASLLAEEKKIQLKAPKGHKAEYTVKDSSTSEGEFNGNAWRMENETEITYEIEVAERKENGDAVIKVAYKAVKAKQSGRDRDWEFDSAKKDEGDEAADALRKTIAGPITVEVSGGKVTEISGITDAPRGEGAEAFRGARARRIAGRNALQRHIEMILASPAQGQNLEKGKEYKQEARRSEDGDGEGRRRFRGRDNYLLSYKYDGEEKVGGANAAKFKVAAFRPPSGGDGPQPKSEDKSEGTALVSLEDGLLVKLDVATDSVTEFERDGQTSKISSKSKLSVERKGGSKAKEERTALRL